MLHIAGLNWWLSPNDGFAPLRSWVGGPGNEVGVRALCRTSDRTFVNTLPKVVGFLRVLRFPPTGKVDRVGLD